METDDFEVITGEDTKALTSKPLRFSSTDLRRVLHHRFGCKENFGAYYDTTNAIIFAPCSDNPTPDSGLIYVEQTLLKYPFELDSTKLWLFPVIEECNYWFAKRNHWVILCYDPINKIASLIDSIAKQNFNFNYNIQPIFDSLSSALRAKGMKPIAEKLPIYQGCQTDSDTGGAWAAMNVIALAEGISVNAIKDYYKADELCDVNRYLCGTQQTRYIPLKTRLWEDGVNLGIKNCFSANIDDCFIVAKQAFEYFFTDETIMQQEFMSALPVFLDQKKICKPTTQYELVIILSGLNNTYGDINRANWLEDSVKVDKRGYTYKDTSRTFTSLRELNRSLDLQFDIQSLNELPIWKIVLLEAAINYATAEYNRSLINSKTNFYKGYSDNEMIIVQEKVREYERDNKFDERVNLLLLNAVHTEIRMPSKLLIELEKNLKSIEDFVPDNSFSYSIISCSSDTRSSIQNPNIHADSPTSSYAFQLSCFKALLAISVCLAVLTILASPSVAALGLTGGAQMAVMVSSAILSGVSLASSVYGLYHYHEKEKQSILTKVTPIVTS